ncbi:MAG TPA: ABC transporter ATP-binding protein [Kofleriaceae bacterium]|nr:ABC transporter ATP-binding protein [Kofleriaceae bacterium]
MAAIAQPAPKPAGRGPEEEAVLGKAYDVALLRRLWPYVRPHWRLLAMWALFMPLTIALELAQPALFQYALTTHILLGDAGALPFDAAAYMLLVVGQGGSSFCETWFLQLAGQRTMHALRITIFDKVLAQRAAFFDRIPVGRLMTRMTNDIESLNEMFAQGAITLVADVVKMLAIVAVMLWKDWRLTLFAFLTVPIMFVLVEYSRRLMRASFRQIRVRLAAMNAFAQEHLSGIKVVQLLGRGSAAQREYNAINAGHRDAYLGQIRADSAMYAIVEAIESVAVGIVLWFASGRNTADIPTIGLVVVFIEYLKKFFIPVKDLSQKYAVMQGAMAAAERIFQLLDTDEPDGGAARPAATVPSVVDADRPALELRDVQFSYGAEPVLRGVDLVVPRGATVAVVGATGSGKSTMIKLLTRLYERDRGTIALAGRDIGDLPLADLRRRITVVSQDVVLFAGPLAENITLGRPTTPAELDDAVRRVGLDRALARRASGLATKVAERGTNFSAGERQLVAFARALLRDPEVLILDEATAHVDPEAEALIERGVAELMKGRTTLVIAHRLSTIRNADLIVVMDKGQVVEQGRHDELVARGGLYAALERTFRRQDG